MAHSDADPLQGSDSPIGATNPTRSLSTPCFWIQTISTDRRDKPNSFSSYHGFMPTVQEVCRKERHQKDYEDTSISIPQGGGTA